MKNIYLISAGPGGVDFATVNGLKVIGECHELYAPKRLAEIYKSVRGDIIEAGIDETISKVISSDNEKIGVLISGDAGFYSVSKRMVGEFGRIGKVEAVAGVSSLSYLCAKVGLSYDDMFIMSLHGRSGSAVGAVSYHEKVFILTGGLMNTQEICRDLAFNGIAGVEVIAGENLGMRDEMIFQGSMQEALMKNFTGLTSLIFINKNFTDPCKIIKDGDFIRGDIPMTKEEIRRLCVAELNPKPSDIVYDIGAGTGSVSVEIARKATGGLVYAVEKEPEGIDLICKNREKFGAYNILPVGGEAPHILAELPPPDKVFIGGSSGKLGGIIGEILKKNPNVKFVITAITLETLSEATDCFKNNGIEADIVCINAAKAVKIGGYHMMTARNPVYIISGEALGK